jgi:hypothetical protein
MPPSRSLNSNDGVTCCGYKCADSGTGSYCVTAPAPAPVPGSSPQATTPGNAGSSVGGQLMAVGSALVAAVAVLV